MKKLLYAAYGSNLLKERFMVYIKGGEFNGRHYDGCVDKTEPEDYGYIKVPYRIYFAKKSFRWRQMGVAFMDYREEENEEYHAVVRLWKISEKQFECLNEQEGKSLYNKILILGKKDNLEIKTITGDYLKEIKKPSNEYLDIIKKGLKETTNWSDDKIQDYLNKFK